MIYLRRKKLARARLDSAQPAFILTHRGRPWCSGVLALV